MFYTVYITVEMDKVTYYTVCKSVYTIFSTPIFINLWVSTLIYLLKLPLSINNFK